MPCGTCYSEVWSRPELNELFFMGEPGAILTQSQFLPSHPGRPVRAWLLSQKWVGSEETRCWRQMGCFAEHPPMPVSYA